MATCFNNRPGLRAVALAAAAFGLAGCSSAQVPEMSEVKLLPEMRSFLPSNSNTYSNVSTMRTLKQIGPQDLVDGQGLCAGMGAPTPVNAEPGAVTNEAAPPAPPFTTQPVALEMTECEVARALGPPTRAEVGSEGGERTLAMTYLGSDRSGIYRFKAGRLVTIERGPEPPPEAKPEKKAKKAAPTKKPPKPAA